MTKTNSNATPITTNAVQCLKDACSEEPQSSKLARELLKADSSVLEFHEGQEHLATLQLIAVVSIVLLGILTLICVDSWAAGPFKPLFGSMGHFHHRRA
jgi:hypothetical protein